MCKHCVRLHVYHIFYLFVFYFKLPLIFLLYYQCSSLNFPKKKKWSRRQKLTSFTYYIIVLMDIIQKENISREHFSLSTLRFPLTKRMITKDSVKIFMVLANNTIWMMGNQMEKCVCVRMRLPLSPSFSHLCVYFIYKKRNVMCFAGLVDVYDFWRTVEPAAQFIIRTCVMCMRMCVVALYVMLSFFFNFHFIFQSNFVCACVCVSSANFSKIFLLY